MIPLSCIPRGGPRCNLSGFGCLVMFPEPNWPLSIKRTPEAEKQVLRGNAFISVERGEKYSLWYEFTSPPQIAAERLPLERDTPLGKNVAEALGYASVTLLQGNYPINSKLGKFGGVILDVEAKQIAPRGSFEIVVLNKLPIVCAVTDWGIDGSNACTVGELHNAALIATYGERPPAPKRGGNPPSIASILEKLEKSKPMNPQLQAMIRDKDEMYRISTALTVCLQEAGLVDRDGRFLNGAFDDPLKPITYLQNRKQISTSLSSQITQLISNKATVTAFAKALDSQQWTGRDVVAASVLSNIALASNKYWNSDSSASRTPIWPGTGFWDTVGGILLVEFTPATSIVGGYLMSCAANGGFI